MPGPRAIHGPFAMSEANDSQFETQAYIESVGSRLRHEREMQHISEKEAAHKLRLMVTDLRAIEADRYNSAAHDDLLRNHLRDYANFLTLNPDSILAIYDRQAGTSFHRGVLRIDDIPRAKPTNIGSLVTDSLIVATAVLGFLVVMQFTDASKVNALLAGIDNRQQANAQQSALAQPSDTAAVATTDGDFDLTKPAIDDKGDAVAGASLVSADFATAQLTRSDDELVDQSSGEDQQTQSAAVPQPSANEADEQQNTSNEVTEVAAAYRNDNNAETAVAPIDATDELAFRFAKDCWVEVYDADEKRLVAEVRKAGGSLQLSGKSPFRILVGYSREVVLQFNDHPVEIEKIERSFSTLFKVERANNDTATPKVTTIRRKLPDNPAATSESTRAAG